MNENERMRRGKGVKSKLLRCDNDYNGLFTIRLRGQFWDNMLTKWDKTYHYNFIILFSKLKSKIKCSFG
jgi:hypothetical protein